MELRYIIFTLQIWGGGYQNSPKDRRYPDRAKMINLIFMPETYLYK